MTTAAQRIEAALNAANEAHGRFTHWNGTETLTLPLAMLRGALAHENYPQTAVGKIVAKVNPRAPMTAAFRSWAGPTCADVVSITVNDLLEVLGAS